MQSLSDLADLRDRGSITPEDFEARKAELLRLL
jgi:Short C-terminal domain